MASEGEASISGRRRRLRTSIRGKRITRRADRLARGRARRKDDGDQQVRSAVAAGTFHRWPACRARARPSGERRARCQLCDTLSRQPPPGMPCRSRFALLSLSCALPTPAPLAVRPPAARPPFPSRRVVQGRGPPPRPAGFNSFGRAGEPRRQQPMAAGWKTRRQPDDLLVFCPAPPPRSAHHPPTALPLRIGTLPSPSPPSSPPSAPMSLPPCVQRFKAVCPFLSQTKNSQLRSFASTPSPLSPAFSRLTAQAVGCPVMGPALEQVRRLRPASRRRCWLGSGRSAGIGGRDGVLRRPAHWPASDTRTPVRCPPSTPCPSPGTGHHRSHPLDLVAPAPAPAWPLPPSHRSS